MVGNIAVIGEYAVLLQDPLDAVFFVVIKLGQILVIFITTGLLDHVLAVFLRGMDVRRKIKLIQIFGQLADAFDALRLRQMADRAELGEVMFLKTGAHL